MVVRCGMERGLGTSGDGRWNPNETEGKKNQWSRPDFSQGQSRLVERPKGNRDSPVGFSSQEAKNEERNPLRYTALR